MSNTDYNIVMAAEVDLAESICEYNVGSIQKGDEDYQSVDDLRGLIDQLPKGRALIVWNTDESGTPAGGRDEVVAYTLGSIWLCMRCVDVDLTRMEPTKRSHLVEGMPYFCDGCREKIK